MTQEELVEKFEQENITLASYGARVAAFGIDEFILSVLFFFAYYDSFVSAGGDVEGILDITSSVMTNLMIMKVLYHSFFVWMYGATPGKMVAKIRVIYIEDLDNPNLLQATSRSFIRVISEMFFYLGFVWAFASVKRQTWQDLAAKTLVVNAK